MSRLLVTPTLYNDWRFYHLMDFKVKQDFLNTLLKVPMVRSQPMQDGIDFEDDVRAVADGHVDPTRFEQSSRTDCVIEIANIVRGGLWQERVKREVSLCGLDLLLYGKADVFKRDFIFDIKWTANGSGYEPGKYKESIQHPLYMICGQMPRFAYLITDGKSVWREDYHVDDSTEHKLLANVAAMVDSIMSDVDFKKAYLENWGAKTDEHARAA